MEELRSFFIGDVIREEIFGVEYCLGINWSVSYVGRML